MLSRRIGVHNQPDIVDVKAARGDVGGHEGRGPARVERLHVAGAGSLTQVAMQLHRDHTAAVELTRQRLGAALGAREHHGAPGSTGQVDHHRQSVLALDLQQVVRHGAHLSRVGLVGHRLVEELLHNRIDLSVERGGEQQSLAPPGCAAQEPPYRGQEPEIGHVVGLVEHGHENVVQGAVPLADQILEATRAREDDVDAAAERRDLRLLADTPEHGARRQTRRTGKGSERLVDLADQLPGGSQDQRAWCTSSRAWSVGKAGDQRQEEGVGLA